MVQSNQSSSSASTVQGSAAPTNIFPTRIQSSPHPTLTANSFPNSSQLKSCRSSTANSASSKTPTTPPSEAPPMDLLPHSIRCCTAPISSASVCLKVLPSRSETASSFAIQPPSQSVLEGFR